MFAVTRPSLLKSINSLFTRTFFGKNLQKFIEDVFRNFHVCLATKTSCICLLKIINLQLLFHLTWPRWFNFLDNDFTVFKFDYIFLQCSILSFRNSFCLCMKKNNKKSLLLSYPILFFEHVTPNTYIFCGLSFVSMKIENRRN